MTRLQRLVFLAIFLFLPFLCFAQSAAPTGSVTIFYTFSRLFRIASNQYAIWIEDEQGSFVRTLTATSFVSKRAGWKIRKQAVPVWVKAAGIPGLPQKDVDAVSSPTPRSGAYKVVWDLKDSKGKAVAAGTYRYLVEGNISWDNEVLWTGTILIGGAARSSTAAATYSPADAQRSGVLISGVSAAYTP